MGSSDLKLLLIAGLIMKLFVVSAVLLAGVALAEPGHNHHHRGHKGHGYRTRGYYYGKREAEPEATAVAEANAEADADAYYGGYYGYGLGYGLGYGYGGYGLGYGYGGYGGYGLGFYGKREAEPGHHHGHGKREADAEPGHRHHHKGHGYGYRTRGYYYGKGGPAWTWSQTWSRGTQALWLWTPCLLWIRRRRASHEICSQVLSSDS